MNDTREAALSVVRRTLAADCGCDEKAFELDGISFIRWAKARTDVQTVLLGGSRANADGLVDFSDYRCHSRSKGYSSVRGRLLAWRFRLDASRI